MAPVMTGVQRGFGKLPIRHKLASMLAAAALVLLILWAAWIFYSEDLAPMREASLFILVAILAGLAGFGLAKLVPGARREKTSPDPTAAPAADNEHLKRTIEELESARLRAEAASKAKSDFLANMSHELRTPLNAIIGFSDLMKSETLGPLGNKTYADYAADINFSGTHLLEIINDVLDVARHESGNMELKEEIVDVEAVIGEALRLITPQAMRGQVKLAWRAPAPALPAVFCDRVRVRQMLLNILSNAVKFTEPGGLVEVTAEPGDGLQLIVKDSGVGIKPDDIARVMTPFGQVGSVYSRNQEGAGLGLTLTKALIESHGGRLSLHSAPGVGTTVRLSFPAKRLRPRLGADMAVGRGLSD